ncbi:MBL fold metallo-hydrolase [Treponema sp.]|uniref:MBL fold metallo-hydrolase n=1 Tax=Treponema sp. TaxID=166 RepID=UPI0025F80EB4|nr:MBL fold metallo-hydrolase [Treponema sp.]MCR5219257.1 MBL fold metallo-hydrolase [Treponema sp.]
MKFYFNLSFDDFTNCYTIVNDDPSVMEAIIVDPGVITPQMIETIERDKYKVTAVLITHNHTSHVKGLSTLMKIYSPRIYAADYEVAGKQVTVLQGDGEINTAGLKVQYFSVPGHTSDSMVFKIGNALFTGDTITSGIIGETASSYSKNLLKSKIQEKIFSQTDETVIMPGHGPPTTVASEKQFNLDVKP